MKDFDEVCEKWEKSFKENGKEIEYNQKYSRIYGEVRGAGFNGDIGEKLHRCAVMEWTENETETFAKFLSLPTAETQTQVFSCFQLFSPQIPPNFTPIPPLILLGYPIIRHPGC
ncbi:TPA: hypothetical protein ACFOQ2_001630, partial [Neisseria meningitidis]